MIITSLQIGGFGRLADRRFDFAPGLNIVHGANESGKSTLANAIVASLYGAERKKESWRPWSGAAFATTLNYRLRNGEEIEVQRDFDRDAKGVRVYDRSGNELSGRLGGQRWAPGAAHLGMPLEVFLNAACVRQQAVAIGSGKVAGPTAEHLARALDGGPREDAARGALERLDAALRTHVGTPHARTNIPLRALRERAGALRDAAAAARRRLAALDDVRDRSQRAAADCDRLTAAAAEIERRGRSLRAGALAKRLADLHEFRREYAELQRAYAEYDDVAAFAVGAERDVDDAYHAWETAEAAATAAARDARAAQLDAAGRRELDILRASVGSIGADEFARLSAAHEDAEARRAAAAAAAGEAAAARRAVAGSGAGALSAAVIVALCLAVGFAIAHTWTWTGLAAAAAAAAAAVAAGRSQAARRRRRAAAESQQAADAAHAADAAAAAALAAMLAGAGVGSFAELVRRRADLGSLLEREHEARQRTERMLGARAAAEVAAARFDELTAGLLSAEPLDRAARKESIRARASRRRERDGIGAHLHALDLRRSTIVGGEDESSLEAELADFERSGVEPADGGPGAMRALEAERAAVADGLRAARDAHARLSGEIAGLQSQIPDLAELDERIASADAEIARLEAFERAITLAKTTLETRTREAHAAFARRLEDDAARTLAAVTDGRYAEIFVDPASLTIRVRVPETQAIEDLESLSAGTRDQAYLVVRLAMARLFAAGNETPPLLLDDPFAFWDEERIQRCLPIVEYAARDAQAILFTSSRDVADAARDRGAHRIDLPRPVLAA